MPFDQSKADRAISFIENYLKLSTGEYAGKPFRLLPFQREFISKLFGTVRDDGTRQYRTTFLSLPRKNGKTEIACAIAAYLLFAEPENGAQVYSAAYSRQQASILFAELAKMIRQNPALLGRSRILDSTKRVLIPKRGTVYAALSADSSSSQGLNPSGVLFDEVAEQRNMELWGALTTGSDTRRQPLFVAIGTAGVTGESPLAEHLFNYSRQVQNGIFDDPTFLPMMYTIPDGADWTEEETWRICNPALCDGGFLKIDSIREHFERATRFPSEEAQFKRYRLNMFVQQSERWIPLEEFDACRDNFDDESLKLLPAFIGVDLSSTMDLSAVVTVWVAGDRLYARWKYFFPDADIAAKSAKARIPFDQWANAGVLQTTPGRVVNYDHIRAYINEQAKKFNIREVCYDPWNAAQFAVKLAEDNLQPVKIRQNMQNLSPACRELERIVIDRTLVHEGDPITRFCFDSAAVKQELNGNMMLTKPDRIKAAKRVDGVSALLTVISRISAVYGQAPKPSIYETRDLLVL